MSGKNIVYTSESGTEYTMQEVIEIAKGNKKYAQLLIDRADWEHIETIVEQDLLHGEIIEKNGTYLLTK